MKSLSFLLFISAILITLLSFSDRFFWLRGPLTAEDEPVIRMQAKLDNIVEVSAASPRLDTIFHLNSYLDQVILRPGFRIVHDPTLGREVRASGPAAQLRSLRLRMDNTTLKPDFGSLFRTDQLVTLRLNLTAHGNNYVSLQNSSRVSTSSAELRPTFLTAGPLEAKLIRLSGVYTFEPIDLRGLSLELENFHNPEQLRGTVDHLRVALGENKELPPRSAYPGLRFDRYDSYVDD